MSWTLDAAQIAKYTALFHDLATKAGGVSELEKSAAVGGGILVLC